jgi:hypothetical protein
MQTTSFKGVQLVKCDKATLCRKASCPAYSVDHFSARLPTHVTPLTYVTSSCQRRAACFMRKLEKSLQHSK